MCDPPSSSSGKGIVFVVSAAIVGGVLAFASHAKDAPTKAVEVAKAAPVAHAGFPWLVAVGFTVAGIVLATLAFVVVRLRRRERVVPPPQVSAPQRALTRGPQRELTTSAQAWVREPDKTEVKR